MVWDGEAGGAAQAMEGWGVDLKCGMDGALVQFVYSLWRYVAVIICLAGFVIRSDGRIMGDQVGRMLFEITWDHLRRGGPADDDKSSLDLAEHTRPQMPCWIHVLPFSFN